MTRLPTARQILSWVSLLAMMLTAGSSAAIPRDEVMTRARAYAYHPWRCTTANLTASCSSTYHSDYLPGDYLGLAYDWGGYMTIFEYDQQIAKGYGAGSYSADGVLLCTSGLDCSGYVSKCWDAGHWSTRTLHNISSTISQASILPGDAFNKAGSHVILYSHTLANGEPIFYEAGGYNVHITTYGGWSHVSGFSPIRYNKISGTSAGNPAGTLTNPITIGALPYTDSRDTSASASDSLDGCGATPTRDETGPEYVYKVNFKTPGTVTIQVSDDVGAEIDVSLYGSLNTSDCLASHDAVFSQPVDCGTYYIVADSHDNKAGKYTLKVAFTPATGQACGSGPPSYSPQGKLGDSCANPNNQNLPFCNPNLGATLCIYGQTSSFCSRPCTNNGDCGAFAGGCCKDINGKSEYYCMPSGYCAGVKRDGGVPPKKDTGSSSHDGPPSSPDGSQVDTTAAPNDGNAVTETGPGGDGSSNTEAGPSGDGAMSVDDEGGCSCRTTGTGDSAFPLTLLVMVSLLGIFRRRSR